MFTEALKQALGMDGHISESHTDGPSRTATSSHLWYSPDNFAFPKENVTACVDATGSSPPPQRQARDSINEGGRFSAQFLLTFFTLAGPHRLLGKFVTSFVYSFVVLVAGFDFTNTETNCPSGRSLAEIGWRR